MSTTQHPRSTSSPPGPGRSRAGLARLWPGLAASAVAGLVVVVVGLPADTVFDTHLSDLTVPAALLVGFGGVMVTVGVATRRGRWRVVEMLVASVLGIAGGLLFAVFNAGVYPPISTALGVTPAVAVVVGVWLVPAVLGGLVVRKPGAAVYTELVAAVLSALIGNQWGFSTVWYGLVEGLGAEVVFALLLYRSFGLLAALAAGAGAGVTVGLLDTTVYYTEFSPAYQWAYIAVATASGVVIAGAGSWGLTRALARTGALAPLASGRAAQRV